MRNRQKTKTVGNTIVNEAAEGAVASKPSAMGSIGINHVYILTLTYTQLDGRRPPHVPGMGWGRGPV